MTALFHIVDADTWSKAQTAGEYRAESLAEEGFIHCSFREQVAATVRRRFAGVQGLVVVELDPDAVPSPIVVEDSYGGGVAYPHIYGPIPVRAAIAVHEVSAFDSDTDAASPDQ